MDMQPKHRGQWATNLGFILAAAGSAVGLGNIWKFPGKVGENGGGAFIIVYLAIVLILGYTVMLTELTVGRATQKNTVGAFRQLDRRFTWIGVLGVITGFFVLSYYSVVGGWVMKYIVTYLTGGDFGLSHEGYFNQFIAKIGEPVGWHLLFMAIVVLVVLKGVSGGIEKVGKVFMPALFLFFNPYCHTFSHPGWGAGRDTFFAAPGFFQPGGKRVCRRIGTGIFFFIPGNGSYVHLWLLSAKKRKSFQKRINYLWTGQFGSTHFRRCDYSGSILYRRGFGNGQRICFYFPAGDF